LLHILPHEIAKIIFCPLKDVITQLLGGAICISAKAFCTVSEDIYRALADIFIKTQKNRQSASDNWNRRSTAGSL